MPTTGAVSSEQAQQSHDDQTIASASPPPARTASTSTHPTLSPTSWLNGLRRPHTSPVPSAVAQNSHSRLRNKPVAQLDDERRRDSGAPSSTSGPAKELGGNGEELGSAGTSGKVPTVPEIVVQGHSDDEEVRAEDMETRTKRFGTIGSSHRARDSFHGITTSIPIGGLEDLTSPGNLAFSKRGTLLLNGERINAVLQTEGLSMGNGQATAGAGVRPRNLKPAPRGRILSIDEAVLSQRVRSMYEHGDEDAADWEVPPDTDTVTDDIRSITPGGSDIGALTVEKARRPGTRQSLSRKASNVSRRSSIVRDQYETAGGMEDWEDIQAGEVDRYGFILPKKETTSEPSADANGSETSITKSPGRPPMQRVSTSLALVSSQPRPERKLRRPRSIAARSVRSDPLKRRPSHRSLKQGSLRSARSASTAKSYSRLRLATNRLPHNRNRRVVDEASDMLTLPPGLESIAEDQDDGRMAMLIKRREWAREEKWRKMAKVASSQRTGGGMVFEFDKKDPKLVSRVWKGIPDRWRATAWYAFMSTEAKQHKSLASEDQLVEIFHQMQGLDCVDDPQIDVDVPRTIGSHIMFRRRYRGGQRLLFRVLHAISLYLPETGYVQGMAALAATLLCYFDEDNAFIMLVRLWQLRGLDRLYQAGFEGLMETLDQFEKEWLAGNDVSKKLEELGIHSTAYGTRWYLTLFNYSIPFPAQLRVWDVFMLLGGTAEPSSSGERPKCNLDVLHATSAALIDATREILLDSDFENAMKVLTSWIPVKDEDLLMKVAKAEWKAHEKRKRAVKG